MKFIPSWGLSQRYHGGAQERCTLTVICKFRELMLDEVHAKTALFCNVRTTELGVLNPMFHAHGTDGVF